MFVGKPHRGIPGVELSDSSILDPTVHHLVSLMNKSWPYWQYTREICEAIFGKTDPWDNMSFTNIIKCTNVDAEIENRSNDTTTLKMADSCIKNNEIIFKEIIKLRPNHIIFYTYDLFKDHMQSFPFEISSKQLTLNNHKVQCGKKNIGWWTRSITTEWSENVKCLVTHHPERKKKDDYIHLITDWVKS